MAQGTTLQQIAWEYRIGKSTAHYVIKETCNALFEVLAPELLKPPSNEEWLKIKDDFYNLWNLPNCVGAIDGKHVVIKAPVRSGSEFHNYKKTFSIVLMAACDARYKFTLIDIGSAGGNHDSAVFKASGFGDAILKQYLNIPGPQELPNTNIQFPHFFAADAAFPLHESIMRPYPGSNLGIRKNIFNYRLSRGRRTIENTFGIWSSQWRIIRKTQETSVEVTELVIQATIVLHNFLKVYEEDLPPSYRTYCPLQLADELGENGQIHEGAWREENSLRSVNRLGSNNPKRSVRENREILADYFVSGVGSVPWQEQYVLRGAVPHGF